MIRKTTVTNLKTDVCVELKQQNLSDGELIKVGEEIVFEFIGAVGLIFNEGISIKQFHINKLGQTLTVVNGAWTTAGRKAEGGFSKMRRNLSAHERRALDWVGRGVAAVRPDDKLSLFYGAVEALVPKAYRKSADKCDNCGRPYATEPIRKFLVTECDISDEETGKIIKARGDLLHGKSSSILEFERYTEVSDIILFALKNCFKDTFDTEPQAEQGDGITFGNKFIVVSEPVNK